MTDAPRLLKSGLPTEALLAKVKAEPHRWGEHTWRQNVPGSPQRDTEVIYFRYARAEEMHEVRDLPHVANYPAITDFKKELEPLVTEALKIIGAKEWGRTFLVKLRPGGVVTPHIDEGGYADKFERFHICLQSDLHFKFSVQDNGGEVHSVNMQPGELWFFNHKLAHWAENPGRIARISLILDAVAPEFRRERATPVRA